MLFPLYDLNPHSRFPLITLLLIAANVVATLAVWPLPEARQSRIALEYGFVPARLSQAGRGKEVVVPVMEVDRRGRQRKIGEEHLSTNTRDVYVTFLTTMFLHGGIMHLALNMWMLWIFGNNIEDRLGHVMFTVFYVLGGIVATLVFWASDPNGTTPVIGASGAVAAVLGAYAITFPHAKVRTLIFVLFIFVVDMPALVLLGIWFVMQLVSGVMGAWGMPLEPVAFWAHIGGFVAGMILMPLFTLGASPPDKDWRQETKDLFQFDDPRFK